MFNYLWIRKPDFTNLPDTVEYNDYWNFRGWQINKSLKSREKIALEIIPPGSKVLDLGCGNSLLPIKLKEKGVEVEVADISDKVLKGYSESHIQGNVVDLSNVESIKAVVKKKYDFIIMFEVLEHLKYPEQVLAVLSEHTQEFLITVPNSAAYYYRFNLLINGRFFTQWIYHPAEHLRYWSYIDFIDWLTALNLNVIQTYATDGLSAKGTLIWLRKLWKNMFADKILYRCKVNGINAR